MEALLQSAKEVADNESPDKKGPIKISTQGNEGKEESQLHQLRWKMQDAQSQIKELTRRMEEMAGGGGGRGGGGGGSPSVLNTDGLSNALASGSVEQLGGVIQVRRVSETYILFFLLDHLLLDCLVLVKFFHMRKKFLSFSILVAILS